jgi:hypothetical protein
MILSDPHFWRGFASIWGISLEREFEDNCTSGMEERCG